MVRLSNWAVFSWNFLLHRIFRSSVFSRRSKARQTPTHLRSSSPRRNRNSKKKNRNPTDKINQPENPNISSTHLEKFFFFFYCNPKEENRKLKTKSVSLFFNASLSLTHTRDLWREIETSGRSTNRGNFFFVFYVGATREEKGR